MKKQSFEKVKKMNVIKMTMKEFNKSTNPYKNDYSRQSQGLSSQRFTSQSPTSKNHNNSNEYRPLTSKVPISPIPPFNLPQNLSESLPSNNNDQNQSNGEHDNNSFEYKIVQKNKLLIPMESIDQLKNMRLCEKSLLPNEKYYFVSKKNFKLIIEAINQKEYDLQNIRVLLDIANSDLNNAKNTSIEQSTKDNDNKLHNVIKSLSYEKMQLKMSYDDLAFQFNKMLAMHNKLMKLLHFIQNDLDSNDKSGKSIHDQIRNKITDLELNAIIHSINPEVLTKCYNGYYSLDKNELLCKEYRKKILDLEDLLLQYDKINDNKLDNLSEIAKDMIKTKQRLKELNDINERLENENTYVRMSFQNIYSETEGKSKYALSQVGILNNKIEDLNKIIDDLHRKNDILKYDAQKRQEANDNMSKYIEETDMKNNEMSEIMNKISILNETIKEKDEVIGQLKARIADLEVKQTISDSIIKSTQPIKKGVHNHNNDSDINELLNQSEVIQNQSQENTTLKQSKYSLSNSKQVKGISYDEKKDMEINALKEKVESLLNEEKNLYFEGETENIGVNGVNYIGDLFLHLYNQAKIIEKTLQ